MRKILKKLLLNLSFAGIVMVSGCGQSSSVKDITVEDLFNNMWGDESIESISLNMKLDVDISASVETVEDVDIVMGGDITIDVTENLIYEYGNMNMSFLGFDVTQPLQVYTLLEDENCITYNYNAKSDKWIYQSIEIPEYNITENLSNINIDYFETCEFLETSEDDEFYTIKAIITAEDLQEMFGNTINDVFSGLEDSLDYSDLKFDVTMNFDKDSKTIKTFDFEVDISEIEDESFKINKFNFNITADNINDVEIEIPDDVKENAVNGNDIDDDLLDILN